MKALLVNPWIFDFAAYDLWSKPLGLLTIASVLKQSGCEVSLIDCLDRFHPDFKKFLSGKEPKITKYGDGHYQSEIIAKPEIFKNIPRYYKRYGYPLEFFNTLLEKEKEPDIILVTSGMTYWYPAVFEIIKILKQRFPGKKIILGGNYVNLCFEHAKAKSGADYIFKGKNVLEVLSLIASLTGKSLRIPATLDARQILPAYELYSILKYATLRTSAGCPFKCTYCGWYLLEEEFYQQEVDFVVDEIEFLHSRFKVDNFAFYDEALLVNAQKHLIPILKKLLNKQLKINLHNPSGLHIRYITEEIAELLKQSGFVQPHLGFETASEIRQKETGGKTTNQDFLQALKFLTGAGFSKKEVTANILIGLPGQPYEEINASVDLVTQTGVKIMLEEFAPVPGTVDFQNLGFLKDADPLLHNNSTLAFFANQDYQKNQEIKDRVHKYNNSLK